MAAAADVTIRTAQITPVIDRVFDFDDGGAAHKHLDSGGHFGKVIVRGPSGDR
jgi:NADPH:quinone reductase-like Zn-dependent oxidoreductase